jgi:hypothetical protein
MNKIKQVPSHNLFRVKYSYEFDSSFDLEIISDQYRDAFYKILLEEFEIELKSKIYKIDKSVLRT